MVHRLWMFILNIYYIYKLQLLNYIQVATDKCIMGVLFLIVLGVVAVVIVKVRGKTKIAFFNT